MPGHRVVQGRLRPADGVLLHPARCPGQQDVQVIRRHVELHGLVGSNELEFSDAFACHRLPIAAPGPPEVAHGPLQGDLGFGIGARAEVAREDEAGRPGYAGRQGCGDDAGLRQDIDLRQKRRKSHLLLAPPVDGGPRRAQPRTILQGEGDGVWHREGRAVGFEAVARGRIRAWPGRHAGFDDGFHGVDVQIGRNQDAIRHAGVADFRRDRIGPVPGTARGQKQGYKQEERAI